MVQSPFWGVPNQCKQLLPTETLVDALFTQEASDQATAAPAPAVVSDWKMPSESWVATWRLLNPCSNCVTHISTVSPQQLKLRSVKNLAQLGRVQSLVDGLALINSGKWKGVKRWTRNVKSISLEIYMITMLFMIHPCVGVKFLYVSNQLLLRDLVTAFIAQYGVDVTAPERS